MKELILIGGAPLTGKSTLAHKLADKKNINIIGTDEIREILKLKLNPKTYPDLFYDEISIDEFYKKYSHNDVVEGEINQSKVIQKFIVEFLSKVNKFKTTIIEGIAITPEFVHYLQRTNNFQIKPIFLYMNDTRKIEKRLYKRGLWDNAETYDDKYKKIELEVLIDFNSWFISEAKKYHFQVDEI